MESDRFVAKLDARLRVSGKGSFQRLDKPRFELTHSLETGT
jgi:hypothetical protein